MTMPPATRVFANRYELGDEIGHGGMADVYLARVPIGLPLAWPEY